MDFSGLESLLPPPGTTLKCIGGRHYIYKQAWHHGKLTCTCEGLASAQQVTAYQNRKVITWLLKNKDMFNAGLDLLRNLPSGNP